ncbi:MAG: CehA/McbA family metallohydrolase, partial [Pirellulaceae bacterium]|nr:CehA/McbA family metallohydrolase [Pirellulaceae bacterium]
PALPGAVAGVLLAIVLAGSAASAAPRGELLLKVVDEATGQPLAARMHLKDSRGQPVEPPKSVFFKNHFAIDGQITLKLPPGAYTFELERGPEYVIVYGNFQLDPGASDEKTVKLRRIVDMSAEGWWSGDLHVHRPLEQIELLMRADDLHVVPVITWWNNNNLWQQRELPEQLVRQFDTNRFYHLLAGEDERGGGALLYFNLKEPLKIAGAEREYPSPVEFLKQARQVEGAHVDIEKPFWWDMPIWIASGMTHSMGVINNHLWRDGVLDNEAWGKPRDRSLYPGAHGNGRWSRDIYYRLLNCGLRIPPSAGSASGVLPNPVGYNRVYVHCGSQLDYDTWWRNLRAGQVVVTNGPLLRPRVNGQLPGHVFRGEPGETITLRVELQLMLRSPVEYLEVVQDGQVVHEVRLEEYARSQGRLPPVEFERSGWLLVRAVTNEQGTYRYGSTGPYYVEIGGRPRISKQDAQFFLDWVMERASNLPLRDEAQRAQVLAYHRGARDFWQKLVEQANAP